MKIVKITPRGNTVGITIPRDYLRALKWRRGDPVYLEACDEMLLVKRVPSMRLAAAGRKNAGGRHAG